MSELNLSCSICRNPFTAPKFVECLHTFCEECITESLTAVGENVFFKCPECMHETLLKNGTESLVPNLHVMTLQDISLTRSCPASSCVVCSLRDQVSDASHRCLSCSDNLCEICAKGHNSSRATASHRVVLLDELQLGHCDGEILRDHEIRCWKHQDEICQIFCFTCSQPACVNCMLEDHKDHVKKTLEDAAKTKRQVLTKKLKKVRTQSDNGTSIDAIKAELDQLEKEEARFIQTMSENIAFFVEKIQRDGQDALEQGRQKFANRRKKCKEKLQQAESQTPRRENILKVCQEIVNTGGLELVLMDPALRNGLHLLTDKSQAPEKGLHSFKVTFNFPKEKLFCSFFEIFAPLNSDSTAINSMTPTFDMMDSYVAILKPTARNPSIKPKARAAAEVNCTDILDACDLDISSADPSPIKIFRFKFKTSFSVKITTDKGEPDITNMVFRPPNKCSVMDKANGKLKIMKLTGELVYLVNVAERCPPFQKFVHFENGDAIFAVFENTLLILSRHLKMTSQLVLLEKKSMKSEPLLAKYGDHLLVGNLPENEMKVLDANGTLVRSWTSKFTKKFESMNYVTDNQIIITSFTGIGTVAIESETSGLLLTIEGEKKNGLTWKPAQAVVDSNGRILVTDTRRNEISIFTKTGSLLHLFNTMENDVADPSSLFLDGEDFAYVSYRNGRVAVYEMNVE